MIYQTLCLWYVFPSSVYNIFVFIHSPWHWTVTPICCLGGHWVAHTAWCLKRSAGVLMNAHISLFWHTWKKKKKTFERVLLVDDKYARVHSYSKLIMAYFFPPVVSGEKRESPNLLKQVALEPFIIFLFWQCISYSGQWIEPQSQQEWEQLHLKQWLLYLLKWSQPIWEKGKA